MKRKLLIIALVLLSGITIAQQTEVNKITIEIDKLLSAQFKPDEPGATVLVAKKGEIIYKKAFGLANLELNTPMQVDNVFWIASIGKQFTAIAILQLMEQGKLNLQDEITRFIPDYPTKGKKITIEHLLTHTSGIHNFSGMKDPEKKLEGECTPNEVINFFKNLPMRFDPGTKWEYSNSGYFLLGYIIEKITGKPYSVYIENNFFKPLGMNNSLYANDKKIIKNRVGAYTISNNRYYNSTSRNITHVYSAGAIQSTVEDFFKWHQAVNTHKLIKKETLDKAFTKYKLSDGTETDYGYGWRLGNVYESLSVWHGGLIAGFGAIEIYLPKEDVFVSVFSNCDCIYPRDIALRLAALANGTPATYTEMPVNKLALKTYTGVYENQKGQQRIITISENQLFSQLGRGPKSKLKAYVSDMFFFEDDAMKTIEFLRDKKGAIAELITKKPEGNEVWKKTNKPAPDSNGIKVDEKILETYIGEYEIPNVFSFDVVKEKNRMYIKVKGQEQFEIFAESNNKFFTKVNDAVFEFTKDDSGKVTKTILTQGGRSVEAKKIK